MSMDIKLKGSDKIMSTSYFIDCCIDAICKYYEKEFNLTIFPNEVLQVWFSKSLQNFKGIFITDKEDKLFFEFTFNGDKDELYMDVYDKIHNEKFSR